MRLHMVEGNVNSSAENIEKRVERSGTILVPAFVRKQYLFRKKSTILRKKGTIIGRKGSVENVKTSEKSQKKVGNLENLEKILFDSH